ncbi:MAG: ABC transporter substrate-binding protein, partial [Oscillospiraceae bacterium]|nr:ABC transporter substrate-binding protein [Oscillospiraceae bacterium]
MKKTLALVLALVMVLALFAGCGSTADSNTAGNTNTNAATNSSSGTGTTNREDEVNPVANDAERAEDNDRILKFGIAEYTNGYMDSAFDTNCGWNASRFGVGECLFRFDNAMNVVNWLCDSYTVNDEHTEWVFHIRDNAKFSDGCAVTPSKVQASFERLFTEGEKGTAKPGTYLPTDSTFIADDASGNLTVKTTSPIADLTKDICYPTMVIFDVEHTTDYTYSPIGTGPYKVVNFAEHTSVTVERNEYYWNGDVPYAGIELIFMGDASAKAMALKAGQIDLAENITNIADLDSLRADPNFTVTIASGVRTGIANINANEGRPLSNEVLRHAIIKALDRNTMCEITVGGLYTAGFSVLPSILDYGYSELTEVDPYDVDEANRMLDEAGIVDTDGDGIRELDGKNIVLELVTYANRCLDTLGEATVQQLEEIGIAVDLAITDSGNLGERRRNGDYDISYTNWTTVGTGDPRQYMEMWYSKSPENYGYYKDAEYDALYEAYLATFDNAERKEIVKNMQQRLI